MRNLTNSKILPINNNLLTSTKYSPSKLILVLIQLEEIDGKLWKGLAVSGLALTVVTAGSFATSKDTVSAKETKKSQPQNLIVLIGDGMGPAQVSATRYFQQYEKNITHLNLDPYYVGQATTFADRGEDGGTVVSGVVTDSASAGTAFATGHKTYNAGISVSNEDVSKPFASIIEAAEVSGKLRV